MRINLPSSSKTDLTPIVIVGNSIVYSLNVKLSSVSNLIFMKYLPYLPFLLPFMVSILFKIPFQSPLYFLNTSLSLSEESKTKYLFTFFYSICPIALAMIRYKGFTL